MSSLASSAWPQVRDGVTLVVAVGSTEQHGHHLPLSTDTLIAEQLAAVLCDRNPNCVLGPSISYGASGEHQGFPGTLSIGHAALELLLIELVRSATHTFGSVVFVNGHGGNEPTLGKVSRQSHHEGRRVLSWSPSLPVGGDHHAGHTETSVMLAIHPELVGDDWATGPSLDPSTMQQMIDGGMKTVSMSGVLGDPSGATAEEGRLILSMWVDNLCHAVSSFQAAATS